MAMEQTGKLKKIHIKINITYTSSITELPMTPVLLINIRTAQ